MSAGGEPPRLRPAGAGGDVRSFVADQEPFAGFEVSVIVDRPAYAPGDLVRLTVSAVNHRERFVEHHYPAWERFRLEMLDEYHRPVADSAWSGPPARRSPTGGCRDRW